MDTNSVGKVAGESDPVMSSATSSKRTRRDAIPNQLRADVWDRSGGICHYCQEPIHPLVNFTVDHVVAHAIGGSDDRDNLVAACRTCNSRKHVKSADAFLNPQPKPPPPLPVLSPVGPWTLRELRMAKGWTQADLARKVGAHTNTVARWEQGALTPGPQSTRLLALIFGVTLDEFTASDPDNRQARGRPRSTTGAQTGDTDAA